MDTRWRIELLGGLTAGRDGRIVSRFRTHQAGALLAHLAYYSHRAHPRDALVELLWPECDPDIGRHRLRNALTSLRHPLEPPGVSAGTVILADRTTVQFNPTSVTTDVAEFETALRAADRTGSGAEQAQRLEEAVELYSGELLPGYFEPWILPERERLAEAFFQALRQLIVRREQAGDLPTALQLARRAVAADRLREESHQELMRLLAAAGQPHAARRQYQVLKRIMATELGAEPDAKTHALLRAIEEAAKQRRGEGPAVSAVLARPLPPPPHPSPTSRPTAP
jgi:DNA-binding SARP family transcriptional activator